VATANIRPSCIAFELLKYPDPDVMLFPTNLLRGTRRGTALQTEGRGFNSRWCHSGCTMTLGSIQPLTEISTRGVKAAGT